MTRIKVEQKIVGYDVASGTDVRASASQPIPADTTDLDEAKVSRMS